MVGATWTAGQRDRREGPWEGQAIGSFLATAATGRPSATAVVDGRERLTYDDLARSARQLAGGLRSFGAGAGDVVSLQLPNWWETVAIFHGCMAAGVAANPVVPIYRRREVSFILHQARPRLVVIPHRFRGFDYVAMIAPILGELDDPPTAVVVRPDGPLPSGFIPFSELTACGSDTAMSSVDPASICLLLYTSGTTSDPKGVLHNHETLVFENRTISRLFELGAGDTVFMPSPLAHVTGVLYGMILPAMLSAPVVLLDIWDPGAAADLIEAEQCTFTVGATPFLQGLTDAYIARGSSSALEAFLCGGADVPPDLVRRAKVALDATVVRVYGSTELPTFSCGGPCDSVDVAAETDGRPMESVEGRLDERDGVAGELVVRGPELFCGYLDPELNDDAFTDDGFFRTGDLAEIRPDGAIRITGRKKDIIIRGGENISAKEIEDVLYEHPAIGEVAAVSMPDPVLGERVCAFVVSAERVSPPRLEDLTTFLERRGFARQKFPERLEIVAELPKTASGKVQKFRLRESVRELVMERR